MIPKKSLKWGTNSMEFLENFQGIIHKNLFLRNSSEIFQSKSPKLENLGKFRTFVTWDGFGSGSAKGERFDASLCL